MTTPILDGEWQRSVASDIAELKATVTNFLRVNEDYHGKIERHLENVDRGLGTLVANRDEVLNDIRYRLHAIDELDAATQKLLGVMQIDIDSRISSYWLKGGWKLLAGGGAIVGWIWVVIEIVKSLKVVH